MRWGENPKSCSRYQGFARLSKGLSAPFRLHLKDPGSIPTLRYLLFRHCTEIGLVRTPPRRARRSSGASPCRCKAPREIWGGGMGRSFACPSCLVRAPLCGAGRLRCFLAHALATPVLFEERPGRTNIPPFRCFSFLLGTRRNGV